MSKPTREQLQKERDALERKWLRADAILNEATEVVEAARKLFGNGEEARGTMLVDAAARILGTYLDE